MMISSVANLSEDQTSIFLSKAMLSAKLDILRDLGLLKLRSKIRQDNFRRIISDLKLLNGQRTIAIHGKWEPKGGFKLKDIIYFSPSGEAEASHKRGKKEPTKLSSAQLLKVPIKIDASCTELYKFWIELWVKPAVRRSITKERLKKQLS